MPDTQALGGLTPCDGENGEIRRDSVNGFTDRLYVYITSTCIIATKHANTCITNLCIICGIAIRKALLSTYESVSYKQTPQT